MKSLITIISLILILSFNCALAINAKLLNNNDSKNIDFITNLYRELFENRNVKQMNQYFSPNVVLNKDFDPPMDYSALKTHLIDQGAQCIKLNLLPFDRVFVKDNTVIILYTQSCTDKFNKIIKKRIMAVNEINQLHQVSKILVVTHEENK